MRLGLRAGRVHRPAANNSAAARTGTKFCESHLDGHIVSHLANPITPRSISGPDRLNALQIDVQNNGESCNLINLHYHGFGSINQEPSHDNMVNVSFGGCLASASEHRAAVCNKVDGGGECMGLADRLAGSQQMGADWSANTMIWKRVWMGCVTHPASV